MNVVHLIANNQLLKVTTQAKKKENTANTYAITLSSLLMRPKRAPMTSWDAIGNPRELRALTARWIWLMVESSLTAARRMSRVSLDTGIYLSINRKHTLSNKKSYEKGPQKRNLSIPHMLKLPDWFQQQRRESQHLLGQAGISGTGTHPTIKNTSNDHKKGTN